MDTKSGNLYPLDTPEKEKEVEDNQRPVFTVGEILDIRDTAIQVKFVGRRCLVLEGLPGTWVKG